MKRYFVVEFETTAPEAKLDTQDAELARAVRTAMGPSVRVYRGAATTHDHLVSREKEPVQFDPILHDGNEPPGYVPEWEREGRYR